MNPHDAASLIDLCIDASERAGGGIGEIDPVLASKAARDGDIIVLDCRQSEELVQDGRIADSTHVVLDALQTSGESALFPEGASTEQKDTPILCYCRGGVRSLAAAQILQSHGFTCCVSLAGGITAWKSAGGDTQ